MDIVLDTNIIIQSPRMDNALYKALFDYLENTDSSLLMPDIVFEELPVVYRRRLVEEHAKLQKQQGVISALLVSPVTEKKPLDFDSEVAKFRAHIGDVFSRFGADYIAAHPKDALDEQRFIALGEGSAGALLVVVYTHRGEKIRVISARRATPREVRKYREDEDNEG